MLNSAKKRIRKVFYSFKKNFILPKKRAQRKIKGLEVEVITMMYNEAILAPLFVRHYAPWVDKLTVFYSESNDSTRQKLELAAAECGLKTLTILPFEFPKGFDDLLKIDCINRAVRNSSADFVVCVDADEFVYPWPFSGADPRKELTAEDANIIRCSMFQVYRHWTEVDIDTKIPPLMQRRHGAPNVDSQGCLKWHDKPCIIRPDSGIQFHVGCHFVTTPLPYPESQTVWRGVHWGMADDFCKDRYVRDRRDRLSKENLQNNYGVETFNLKHEHLAAFLKTHRNDPLLF